LGGWVTVVSTRAIFSAGRRLGQPDRAASSKPASPLAANRRRHLPTVPGVWPSSTAMASLG